MFGWGWSVALSERPLLQQPGPPRWTSTPSMPVLPTPGQRAPHQALLPLLTCPLTLQGAWLLREAGGLLGAALEPPSCCRWSARPPCPLLGGPKQLVSRERLVERQGLRTDFNYSPLRWTVVCRSLDAAQVLRSLVAPWDSGGTVGEKAGPGAITCPWFLSLSSSSFAPCLPPSPSTSSVLGSSLEVGVPSSFLDC